MSLKKKPDWRKIGIVSLVINLILGSMIGGWWLVNIGDESMRVVTRVVDGDTVDFDDNTRGRLVGIDAPEYPKGCLSKRSKERLEELVLGKKVHVIESGKDNFNRWKVNLRIDGVHINKIMVEEGLAAAIKGASDEIELAETEAIKTKRGIWSSECTAEQEGCVIKGNFHQGTKDKVYHLPDCYNYNQVNINPNEGDRWFCTEVQAEEAGFVKTKDCPQH